MRPCASWLLFVCLLGGPGCAAGDGDADGGAGSPDAGSSGPDAAAAADAGPDAASSADGAALVDGAGADADAAPGCASEADCDDGDDCTADRCGGAGVCEHEPTCECAEAADCLGMLTVGPCEKIACEAGSCAAVPDPARDGTSCDDGDGCTTYDHCSAGTCLRGVEQSCDDGTSCTVDACVSTGRDTYRCDHDVAGGACYIGDLCWEAGDRSGADACSICEPRTSSTDWSVAEGASCDDGDECTRDDECAASGGCAGTPLTDRFESNDARSAAHSLGSVSDSTDFPNATFTATLYPSGDEDWYRYHDSDDGGGLIYPRVDLENLPGGVDYQLCAYFQCDSSFSSLGCEDGSAHTLGGLQGCCSLASGSSREQVRLNPDCGGADDSGTVYVRLWRRSGAATCAPYTLEWGDD